MATNLEQAKELRNQGIAAMRAGRMADAQELLAQSVELNPDDEHAWLWLSGTAESAEDKRFCLEKVLELNPANEAARKGLAKLPPPPAPAPAIQQLPATSATIALGPAAPGPGLGASATSGTIPPAAPFGGPVAAGAGIPSASSYFVPAEEAVVVRRPGCITCLVVLLAFSGVVGFLMLFAMAWAIENMGGLMSAAGMSTADINVAYVRMGVETLLCFIAAIGLWAGEKFGWWMVVVWISFYIVSGVAEALVVIASKGELDSIQQTMNSIVGFELRGSFFAQFMIGAFVRILFGTLLMLFFYVPNTLAFFKLSRIRKMETFGISIAIATILALLSIAAEGSPVTQARQELQQVQQDLTQFQQDMEDWRYQQDPWEE